MTAPASWSLVTFHARLEAKYGRAQRALVEPITKSLDDNLFYQRFHFQEAERLMKAHVGPSATELEVMQTLLSPSPNAEHSFQTSRRRAAAHVLALIRCMHGDEDLIAQLIYAGAAWNLGPQPMKPTAINLRNVRTRLAAGPLANALHALQDEGEAIYISDLCNHGKHRSHVPVPYSLDLSDSPGNHGLRFVEFEKDGRNYPARWVIPILTAEYSRRNDCIRQIGNLLNDALI